MNILLALIVSLLVACSGGNNTTNVLPNPGWENIGTLNQPLLQRTFDVTPSTTSYDLNNATQLSQSGWVGPFLVSISGWVTSSDGSAGALIFNMQYDDPTSTTRDVVFTGSAPTLILSDSTSFFSTPVVSMIRETGTSLWNLDTTLAGLAGSATVHYEIMVLPDNPSDVTFFSDQ